jgi:hypothetical protein
MQDRGSRERKKPKTAPYKGKRLHCARCKKRSPRKVVAPAPWYCPKCASLRAEEQTAAP